MVFLTGSDEIADRLRQMPTEFSTESWKIFLLNFFSNFWLHSTNESVSRLIPSEFRQRSSPTDLLFRTECLLDPPYSDGRNRLEFPSGKLIFRQKMLLFMSENPLENAAPNLINL